VVISYGVWAVAYFITKAVPRAYQLKFKQISPTLSVFMIRLISWGWEEKTRQWYIFKPTTWKTPLCRKKREG
jgi:hypothetical protein